MPSLHDQTFSPTQATPLAANIRHRLVTGASKLAIATIIRRRDAARALN
jgi:hypothetical protein